MIEQILFFFLFVSSETVREDEIPAEFRSIAEEKRQELIESVTNGDDILGELFLAEKTPTTEELHVSLSLVS